MRPSWRTKSQIQALDRSQPVLPMMSGMPERRTHDYLRLGITSLFAGPVSRHPRFHVHFTSTGSSWTNQVERWFGMLADKLIRRGVHTSVPPREARLTSEVSDTGH